MKPEDFDIVHLGESVIESPLEHSIFVKESARVAYHSEVADLDKDFVDDERILSFEKAGPRQKIFHDPSKVRGSSVAPTIAMFAVV